MCLSEATRSELQFSYRQKHAHCPLLTAKKNPKSSAVSMSLQSGLATSCFPFEWLVASRQGLMPGPQTKTSLIAPHQVTNLPPSCRPQITHKYGNLPNQIQYFSRKCDCWVRDLKGRVASTRTFWCARIHVFVYDRCSDEESVANTY